MANFAELCAQLGDAARATALEQLLGPCAGQVIVGEGVCLGPASRYLGLLAAARGDWDAAQSRYESAIGLAESAELPVWRTHARFDLANALLARRGPGDQVRATALLNEVVTEATTLHLVRLREQCLAMLSRTPGVGPLADGLSPAEIRVLRLLASGATNEAIGKQLFLSKHTVAAHVRNILAKTNSANRIEAANYARRYSYIVDE
jgi:DNA-binding CsgD family transcriptional regulator